MVKGFCQVTKIAVTAQGSGGLTETTGVPRQSFVGVPGAWDVPFKFVRMGTKGEVARIQWTVSYSCQEKRYYLPSFLKDVVLCQ